METTDREPDRADEPTEELGEAAPALLSTEHWSLLAARGLIWNEAQSRVSVFLTVLSASMIALAFLADATDFGTPTTIAALVLLPVVFLLGIAAYVRLVDVNIEEFQLMLAMNRLRHAYVDLEPGLKRYLTTGYHDDERGVFRTYMVERPSRASFWLYFLINTPTVVATVDSALAAAMAVVVLQAVDAPTGWLVASGIAAFVLVWVLLFLLQRRTLKAFRYDKSRFPSPSDT
jgi:hypothetical protein